MANRREAFQNQGAFEPQANMFDFRRLLCVETRPAERVVQNADEIADVIVESVALRARPVEEVENLQIETQSITLDDDIVGVEIAMIFPGLVNALQSDDESMEKMHGLSGMESSTRLALQESREQLALDILGDEDRDELPSQGDDFLRMVVDDDRTSSQLVEFPGVGFGGLVARIAMGEKQLCRTLDVRVLFPDLVYLTLPTAAKARHDLVFPSQYPPGFELEGFDGFGFHLPIVDPVPRRILVARRDRAGLSRTQEKERRRRGGRRCNFVPS